MVEKLIESFEELKKYNFLITRKNKANIIFRFKNESFYHLIGLHKIKNFDNYFPKMIKSKDKKYKYIKNNIQKFNNILNNQLKEKDLLKLRIHTFPYIVDLLKGNNTLLYNLKNKVDGSLYNGDFGLVKIYDYNIYCLLGLKINKKDNENINCFPNSWMASKRTNRLTEFKRPIHMDSILAFPINHEAIKI